MRTRVQSRAVWGLGFALMLALVTAAGEAATIHVNGTCGNDAWSGASAACAAPNGPKKTIQAGIDAAVNGDTVLVADGVYSGTGNVNLNFLQKAITLQSENGPEGCIIDGGGTQRAMVLYNQGMIAQSINGLTIRNCKSSIGGAVYVGSSAPTFKGCIFRDNVAQVGGAVQIRAGGSTTFRRCRFESNRASGGGAGAIFSMSGSGIAGPSPILQGTPQLNIVECAFLNNDGGVTAGAALVSAGARLVNCRFEQNFTTFIAGAVFLFDNNVMLVNCSFSRNECQSDGVLVGGDVICTLINCSFGANVGHGLQVFKPGSVVRNCVVWGNALGSLLSLPTFSGVSYSDIQGSWPGVGNIDADPLFVQPGSDDLRLGIGSPCVDAGLTSLLPADTFDLDGDGDVTEPIPFDLAGNPRVTGSSVDMGAYEGEFKGLPPQAAATGIDPGEIVFLVPAGTPFDPIFAAAAVITSQSTQPDASAMLTEFSGPVHPVAGGYSELAVVLTQQTTLPSGQFLSRLFIPINAAILRGQDPTQLDMTSFDPTTGNWRLAVEGNMQTSPGHAGPVGDRIVVVGIGDPGLSAEVGDYGVFWNPSLLKGYVWANVDVAGDFAAGAPLCFADCAPPNGDHLVNATDLASLIGAWGMTGGGVFDLDLNGVVNGRDLGLLLGAWGACGSAPSGAGAPLTMPAAPTLALPAHWGAAVTADQQAMDLDSNGIINGQDLAVLLGDWGHCEGCRADLTGDGVVNQRDVEVLTGRKH